MLHKLKIAKKNLQDIEEDILEFVGAYSEDYPRLKNNTDFLEVLKILRSKNSKVADRFEELLGEYQRAGGVI